MSGGFDFNRSKAGSLGNFPFFGSERINLMAGRTIADGLVLAAGAPPYTVTSAFGRIVWAANAATTAGVEWDISIPGDYARSKPAEDDELQFLLIAKSGASGTVPAVMTPTLLYQRAGSALSSAIALTSYKKAASLDLLEAASFASSTTFTANDAPTHPEAILLKFRAGGLRPFDAARITIAPAGSTNHAFSLFGMWMLPKCYGAIERFRKG